MSTDDSSYEDEREDGEDFLDAEDDESAEEVGDSGIKATGDQGEAEPWDLLSQALGSFEDLGADEEFAIDVSEHGSSNTEGSGFDRVPLEHARNLIEVRALAEGMKDKTLSVEVYQSKLLKMVRSLEDGLKVFQSEAVAKYLQELPQEQRPYFMATATLVETLVRGGKQMLNFVASQQELDIDTGLQTIEQGFLELDALQGRAIEKGQEIALRDN